MLIMSRLEYLTELNRRLMEHRAYEAGMEFVFSPPGVSAEEANGFYWLPNDRDEPMRSIAIEAARHASVVSPASNGRTTLVV